MIPPHLTLEVTHDEWRMICDGRQRRTAKREAWLVKVAEQFGRNSDEYQRAQWPDEPWIDPTEYSLSNPQGPTNIRTVVRLIEEILQPAACKAIGGKRSVYVRWLDYTTFYVFICAIDPGTTFEGWTVFDTDSELLEPKFEIQCASVKHANEIVFFGIQHALITV